MITKPIASAFYSKFASAPIGWLNSNAGKSLVDRAISIVREKEGEAEAEALRNLIDVATCYDTLTGNEK